MVDGGEAKGGPRSRAIELVLARFLRVGSLVAAALLAAAIANMLLGQTVLAPRLITAGLLVLLGTPVMRVLVTPFIFMRRRSGAALRPGSRV